MSDSGREDQRRESKPKVAPAAGATEPRFEFECPRTWNTLAPTAEPSIRHCDGCDKPVYLSRNVKEASEHARLGRCVAVPTMTASPRRSFWRRSVDLLRFVLAALARHLRREPAPPPLAEAAPPPPPVPISMKVGRPFSFYEDEPPPTVGWLVPLDGSQQGGTFKLGNGVTVLGAGKAADVVVDRDGVQKEHCRIVLSPMGFVLHDGGSRVGTLVNGRPVADQLDLVDGQVIAIAGAQFVFKCIT